MLRSNIVELRANSIALCLPKLLMLHSPPTRDPDFRQLAMLLHPSRLLIGIKAEIPGLLGPVRVGITQALDIDATREAPINGCFDELRSKKRERESQIDLTHRA
jgi:hypothetical protein